MQLQHANRKIGRFIFRLLVVLFCIVDVDDTEEHGDILSLSLSIISPRLVSNL